MDNVTLQIDPNALKDIIVVGITTVLLCRVALKAVQLGIDYYWYKKLGVKPND